MSYRYGKADVEFIVSKFKEQFNQKDINTLYHFWRVKRGTETKKGDYSNFISKLSKTSKHHEKTTTTAYEYTEKDSVIRNVGRCLGCSYKQAKKIYSYRVVPVCVSRFHDEAASGLISVRYHPPACNDYLYILFSSEDYDDFIDREPGGSQSDDLWTVETRHEFRELLDGSYTKEDIISELVDKANNQYIPELVNVCVLKR